MVVRRPGRSRVVEVVAGNRRRVAWRALRRRPVRAEFARAFPPDTDPNDIDPVRDGLAILEMQRHHPVSHGSGTSDFDDRTPRRLGRTEVFSVGSFAQSTTAARDQVMTKIIRRWPDEIGQRIKPARERGCWPRHGTKSKDVRKWQGASTHGNGTGARGLNSPVRKRRVPLPPKYSREQIRTNALAIAAFGIAEAAAAAGMDADAVAGAKHYHFFQCLLRCAVGAFNDRAPGCLRRRRSSPRPD